MLAFLANASKSLTLWYNLAMALMAVVVALVPIFPAEQFPKIAAGLVVIMSVGNVLIRILKTSTPILPGPEVPVVPAPAPIGPDTPLQARIAWVIDGVTDVLRGVAPPKETRELGLKTVNELFDLAEKERSDKTTTKKAEPTKVDAAGNLIGA